MPKGQKAAYDARLLREKTKKKKREKRNTDIKAGN